MKDKPKRGRKLSAQDEENIRILEDAAEIILTGRRSFCCNAIDRAAMVDGIEGDNLHPARLAFKSLFYRDSRESDKIITNIWWHYGEIEPRIFALLLAAEVIRTNSQP